MRQIIADYELKEGEDYWNIEKSRELFSGGSQSYTEIGGLTEAGKKKLKDIETGKALEIQKKYQEREEEFMNKALGAYEENTKEAEKLKGEINTAAGKTLVYNPDKDTDPYSTETAKTKKKTNEDKKDNKDDEEKKKFEEQKKKFEEQKKAAEEYAAQLIELEEDAADARVALIPDEGERELAQMALDHKRKLTEIEKQKTELLEKKKAGGKGSQLDESELGQFQKQIDAENAVYQRKLDDWTKAAETKRQEADAQANADMLDYLIKYGEYEQQLAAIHQKYETLRAKPDITEGKRLMLYKQEADEIQKLNDRIDSVRLDNLKRSADYIKAMGDLTAYTSQELEKLKQHLEQMMKDGGGNMPEAEKKAYKEAIDNITKQQDNLKTPFGKNIIAEIKEIRNLEKEIKAEKARQSHLEDILKSKTSSLIALQQKLNELKKDGSGATAEEIAAVEEEITTTESDIKGVNTQLGESVEKVSAMGSQMHSLTNGATVSLSVIDKIVKGVAQTIEAAHEIFNDIKDTAASFGVDTESGAWSDLTIAFDAISEVSDHAQKGWEAIKSGNIVGAVQHTIGTITSVIRGLNALHDNKHEKRIKKLQERITDLQKGYEELERAVSKTYSKVKQSNIELEIQNKQNQVNLLKQSIQEERDKKKTDNKRIQEWEDEIRSLEYEIADLKDEAVDAIFGEDVMSAISNFASAYADAWAANEDRTKSAKEQVRQMMKQMVTESIKSAIQASGAMEQIRQKLEEFYSDNVLSQWEQDYIYNMAEELQNQLDEQFGWAQGLLDDKAATSQDSTSRGFETMTQDQATELNGRFTGIQMSVDNIEKKIDYVQIENSEIRTNTANIAAGLSELTDLQGISVSHLEAIERNTSHLFSMNEKLDKIEKNTRRL